MKYFKITVLISFIIFPICLNSQKKYKEDCYYYFFAQDKFSKENIVFNLKIYNKYNFDLYMGFRGNDSIIGYKIIKDTFQGAYIVKVGYIGYLDRVFELNDYIHNGDTVIFELEAKPRLIIDYIRANPEPKCPDTLMPVEFIYR